MFPGTRKGRNTWLPSKFLPYVPHAKVIKLDFEPENGEKASEINFQSSMFLNEDPGVIIDAGRTSAILEVTPSGGAGYTVPISEPPVSTTYRPG